MKFKQMALVIITSMAIVIFFTTSTYLIISTSSVPQNSQCNCQILSQKEQQQALPSRPKTHYSMYHINKGKCENKFGSIAVLQFVQDKNYIEGEAFNALQSMRCYAKMKGYHLYQFNISGSLVNKIDFDGRNTKTAFAKCRRFNHILSLRHCVAAEMLSYYNYVIHIDADSGVVNPYHCFEEFINPNVDMHFLLRIHTGEIQAGHYIVKNTEFSKQFLQNWADSNISSKNTDQAPLHVHLSKNFLSSDEHKKCLARHRKRSWGWISCITSTMRAKKRDRGKLLLYSRAQTFVRDGWASQFRWSRHDFMFHAMKRQDDVVFTRKLRHEDCENDFWVIPSKKELFVDSEQKMKDIWVDLDKKYFVPRHYAIDVGIGHCWPNCPHLTI